MRHYYRPTAALALALAMFLAACSSSVSSTGNGSSSTSGGSSSATPTAVPTNTPASTNTPAPTNTPNKPTSFPVIDMAFCQRILTLAEVNQIENPVTPATSVEVGGYVPGEGGSCNFLWGPTKVDLFLIFQAYHSGSLDTIAKQAVSQQINGTQLTVTTDQPVSGVGDQALFLAGTASGNGITARGDIFYCVSGSVGFGLEAIDVYGGALKATSDAAVESEFQQLALLVVSRL